MTIPAATASNEQMIKAMIELAEAIRPSARAPYISIISIAHQLGLQVTINFRREGHGLHAKIDMSSCPPNITVFRGATVDAVKTVAVTEEHLLLPRERFSIGHEIGHWLGKERLGVKPVAERGQQYWNQEEWMNAFAAALLLPSAIAMEWLTQAAGNGPINPIELRSWALKAKVSEEVVAHALCRVKDTLAFMKVRRASRSSNGEPVLKVLFSCSGSRLKMPHIHRHLRSDTLQMLLDSKDLGLASGVTADFVEGANRVGVAWRRVTKNQLQKTKDDRWWISLLFGEGSQPQQMTLRL